MVVKVQRVTAPLVVKDAHGEFIYDLSQAEVTLLDNDVPQQLTVFEHDSRPISLVIVVDTSQRIAPLLDRVRKAGVLFTSYVLGPEGEAAVITFDDNVKLRLNFTAEEEPLIRTLTNLPSGGSDTRLADALEQAVRMLESRPEGRRRVIVAITEATDEGSQVALGLPLRRAQLSDISVFSVSFSRLDADLKRKPEDTPVTRSPYPPGVFPGAPVPGSVQTPTTEEQQRYATADILAAVMMLVSTLRYTVRPSVLEVYAAGSGAVNYVPSGQSGFEKAISEIGNELHSQYVLSYRPSNRDQTGFHKIEVKVSRPKVRVRTRAGYYVGIQPE